MNSIERLVLQMIGEDPDTPDVFTDDATGMAQIRDSINDAVQEISMIEGNYKQNYLLPLREGRAFYRFDYNGGSIAWITDAWLTTTRRRLEQTDLYKLKIYNPRWLFDSGWPRSYFPIGLDFIGLWPVPGGDTEVLELNAVIIPDPYTLDTDRIKLRKDLDWAAAHFAIGEYYASRGDAQRAMNHHNQYMLAVGLDMPYYPENAAYHFRSNKEPWPKATG